MTLVSDPELETSSQILSQMTTVIPSPPFLNFAQVSLQTTFLVNNDVGVQIQILPFAS